jgi:hypothetical protein
MAETNPMYSTIVEVETDFHTSQEIAMSMFKTKASNQLYKECRTKGFSSYKNESGETKPSIGTQALSVRISNGRYKIIGKAQGWCS